MASSKGTTKPKPNNNNKVKISRPKGPCCTTKKNLNSHHQPDH